MGKRIAVMIVHGIGTGYPPEARSMADLLNALVTRKTSDGNGPASDRLVIEHVDWSDVLNEKQALLRHRVKAGGRLGWRRMRSFFIEFLGDAIAYQPTDGRRGIYTQIHCKLAAGLSRLARSAGPEAPLVVIAHSLGTVISSNFMYDLQVRPQKDIMPEAVKSMLGDSPLEHGQTFAQFHTLGSPLAVWSVRYASPPFGVPIQVPSPHLTTFHPGARGRWINFYDPDDVISYPLKALNDAYGDAVTEDRRVNAGRMLLNRTPISHNGYWLDREVVHPIAASLEELWKSLGAREEAGRRAKASVAPVP